MQRRLIQMGCQHLHALKGHSLTLPLGKARSMQPRKSLNSSNQAYLTWKAFEETQPEFKVKSSLK